MNTKFVLGLYRADQLCLKHGKKTLRGCDRHPRKGRFIKKIKNKIESVIMIIPGRGEGPLPGMIMITDSMFFFIFLFYKPSLNHTL